MPLFFLIFTLVNADEKAIELISGQEINDQRVIRLSQTCGKNLHPFRAGRVLPMTEKVERELRDLPARKEHPVAKFTTSNQ